MQTDAMVTLKREAACYELARDDAALSRLMPRLVRYDENRHVIIVDLLPEAESLLAYHTRHRTFPVEVGRLLGEGLGLYHTGAGALVENETLKQQLPRQIPLILTLGRGGHAMLSRFGNVGPAPVGTAAAAQGFRGPARRARCRMAVRQPRARRHEVGQRPGLSHAGRARFPHRRLGDGRLWRCRLGRRRGAAELSWQPGSCPCRSPAACRRKPMSAWPPSRSSDASGAHEPSGRPTPGTRRFARDQSKSELERCMRFGAARLVWAAIEQRLYVSQLDPAASALLQVSLNVLKDPPRAVRELLGA